MESKALERLGILRTKRTIGGFVRGIVRKLLVIAVLGLCAWIGFRILVNKGGNDVRTSGAVTPKDDGTLYICEHLSIKKITQFDLHAEERNGRMIATARQQWFRLSIDENWYFKTFVPAVKHCLSEIAPDVEVEQVTLDTSALAYSNDGADRLRKSRSRKQDGDRFDWTGRRAERRPRSGRIGACVVGASRLLGAMRYGLSESDVVPVLLIDGVKDGGGLTCATLYRLERSQFEKFENWIGGNVLRARVGISAKATCNGVEVGSADWQTSDVGPIARIQFQRMSCYAVSPWISVSSGCRYRFLGLPCVDRNGLPDAVDVEWSL